MAIHVHFVNQTDAELTTTPPEGSFESQEIDLTEEGDADFLAERLEDPRVARICSQIVRATLKLERDRNMRMLMGG